jgi:ankyrin repeat protein
MFASPVWQLSSAAIAAVASAGLTGVRNESANSEARIETVRMVKDTGGKRLETLDTLSTGPIYPNPGPNETFLLDPAVFDFTRSVIISAKLFKGRKMLSHQVKFALFTVALILTCACSLTPEEARAKIEALDASFDQAGFNRAVMTADVKLIDLFIQASYDVTTFDEVKSAPLMLAARIPDRGPMKRLIAAGASAEELPGVLVLPATRDDVKSLSMLLGAGATIDSLDASKRSALIGAIEQGRLEAVRFLLDKGASPNAVKGNMGYRVLHPLIEAIRNHHLDVAELLLEAGADPRRTASGIDAIRAAETAGHEELAQQLREHPEP